jgi:hypothetical protein
MDDGGSECTTIWMDLIPSDCTFKNCYSAKLSIMYILPQ